MGLAFEMPVLKSGFNGGFAMRANTALALALLGSGFLLLISLRSERTRAATMLGRGLALVSAGIGGLTLVQHLTGLNLGIDQLLINDPPNPAARVQPGRMGPPAALSLLLLGTAILLLDTRTRRGRVPSQWLAIAASLVVGIPLIGYVYAIPPGFPASPYVGISLPSAAAIIICAVAIMAARPTWGITGAANVDDVGGLMIRRVLLPAILMPPALGWLSLAAVDAGLLTPSFGYALFTLALIVGLALLIWGNARAMSTLGRTGAAAEAERERLLQEVRVQHERMMEIFESISDAFYAVDADFHFTFINQRAEQMWQRPRSSLIGQHMWTAFPRDVGTEPYLLHQRVMKERQPLRCESLSPLLGRWLDITLYPEAGGGISCYFRDIHDRRQAEEDLRRAKEEAERASEAKSQFLATLSHEMRTPLTPVLLHVSLLEGRTDLPDDVREDLASIRRNVELESMLISDLLDLTRIERGMLQLELRDIDVHQVLKAAVATCEREGGASIVMKLQAERHVVCGDSTRLQQIFWNLISNALKFTPPSGRITVRSTLLENSRIRIEVSDTGRGIESDLLGRLFNAFEQGDVRAERRQAGLGLGLAISRKIAEAHGGTIIAESKGRGHGASFIVDLPLIDAHVRALTVHPFELPAVPVKTLDILLVEDHEPTLNVMAKLLEKMGHRVCATGSVATALESARQTEFGLVISDLGLPDGSGLDVMRQLGPRYVGQAIALTGYGMESDVAATREVGFAEHLTKPVDFNALQAAMQRIARRLQQVPEPTESGSSGIPLTTP